MGHGELVARLRKHELNVGDIELSVNAIEALQYESCVAQEKLRQQYGVNGEYCRRTLESEKQLAAAQAELSAWKTMFGTTQLTHAIAKLEAAQAECAELKYGNAELIKHRNELQATCSNWDKALSSLAAMVMRYFKSINYRPSGNGDVADDLYHKCNKRGDDERALVNECAKLREELAKYSCGDCDPCVGGRPDQCALKGCDVNDTKREGAY